MSNHNKVTSSKNGSIYKHNSPNRFGRFYDPKVNELFIIEPVMGGDKNVVKRLSSFQMETKALIQERTPTDPTLLEREEYLKTFDDYFVYDSYQMSEDTDIVNTKTARNTEGYWSFNEFRDKTLNNGSLLFINNNYLRNQNLANIDPTKHWTKQKKFVDYWFVPRLTFDNNYQKPLGGAWTASGSVLTGVTPLNLFVGDILYINDGTIKIAEVLAFTPTTITIDIPLVGTVFTEPDIQRVIPVNLNFLNIFAKTERNAR
jgi:hypothetical protein